MDPLRRMKRCIVPSCKNTSQNSSKIFIHVPQKRASQWFNAVGRFNIPKKVFGYYCCEDHFYMESDCENWQAFKLLRSHIVMKPDVVPHKYIHEKSGISPNTSQFGDVARKRKLDNMEAFSSVKKVCQNQEFDIPSVQETAVDVTNPLLKFISKETQAKPSVSNKGIQVAHIVRDVGVNTPKNWMNKRVGFGKSRSTVESPLENCSPSLQGSSSESFQTHTSSEDEIIKTVSKNSRLKKTLQICKEHPRFYLGLSEDTYYIVNLLEKHSEIRAIHILIILKKIRLNDPYYRLAVDFNLTIGAISKIINTNLPKVAKYFGSLIIWPSAEDIKLNLPIPFRKNYADVQSIIDCFEVQIEKPSNPINQALTWSDYKKCNTLKYLISSLPNGPINFISCGFGGRITDTEIVQQSNYLKVLPKGCHVMADRGFKQIEILLKQKNCTLVRPPSVLKNVKATPHEVKESKRIAGLRILIERVIGRLREFSSLKPHSCFDNKLVSKADYMIEIACGLVNLEKSMFAK